MTMTRNATAPAPTVPDQPDNGARELLHDALELRARRRRLEAQRERLTAETDRVVLELVETLEVPLARVAELLGVSAQRMSQLYADAKRRRDAGGDEP